MVRRSVHIIILIPFLLYSSPSQPLSTTVHLSDWGIDSIAAIITGQCAVVHDVHGDRLQVQSLFDRGAFLPYSADTGSVLLVTDPHSEGVNFLGGSSSFFAGNGAAASLGHTVSNNRVAAVAVSYTKGSGGYCGLWMHLFNSAAPRELRRYLDATSYRSLLFAIRGTSGTERVRLKIADQVWNDREDAMTIGECGQYVPAGKITTTWQTARVPLVYLPERLDRTRLASLVFEAVSPDSGAFEVGPVAFSRDPGVELLHRTGPGPSPRNLERSLWVWDTEAILAHHAEDSLLLFVRTNHFNNVYLGLPYDSLQSAAAGGVVLDKSALGPLVRTLSDAGATVQALTGDKDFVLPARRDFVRNTMQHIVEYNAAAAPEERFSGIHLDVEPYLLPGFTSPNQAWFISHFLDMVKDCAAIAHRGGMTLGADVPPWYDSANELTHQYMRSGPDGRPFYQQLIDLLDETTLMDYRTSVDGDNGIVMLAVRELEYAERTGKRIIVGVETHPLPDQTILTFKRSLVEGIPQKVPVVIVRECGEEQTEFTFIQKRNDLDGWLQRTTDRRGLYYWPVIRSTDVPSSAITFATLGTNRLNEVLRTAELTFQKYRSFAGFAIHSYRDYSKLR